MIASPHIMKKVLVGLSGGLDSAVAAKLLIDEGFEVSSCTLFLLDPSYCNTQAENEALVRAKEIALKLGIKHFVYDCRQEFKSKIIEYFVHSYKIGQTPNPCYFCNREIKFGLMQDIAKKEGFDFLATGHYAIVERDLDKKVHLLKAKDKMKDQSYFLSGLNSSQLDSVLFPLGTYTKDEAREIANKYGLFTEKIGESQDICFVSNGDYAAFIDAFDKEAGFAPGAFIDIKGNVLGMHKGLQHYTIGQRRGLALALGYPTYVIKKDAVSNTVTIGRKEELECSSLIAKQLNIIEDLPKGEKINVQVKTRYRQIERQALLTLREHNEEVEGLVEFVDAESAVATGQVAVFYDGECCLGSGII